MLSNNVPEPKNKAIPVIATASATPPIAYVQSTQSIRSNTQKKVTPDMPSVNIPSTKLKSEASPENLHEFAQQSYIDDDNIRSVKNSTNASINSGSDSSSTSEHTNQSEEASETTTSTSIQTSDTSVNNRIKEVVKSVIGKANSYQLEATRKAESSSPGDEDKNPLTPLAYNEQDPGEEPKTIYTEPIAVITNYINKNCNKVDNYWLGTGDFSFVAVFSALMKSFHETGFVSLKQLSMHRAKAPELFEELANFLMQMGLEYVNQMNKHDDITPQNSYSAAYIVACAMECMNDNQRRDYIYRLRRDSNNRLRQRRGFNTRRVEFNRLSQKYPHGISNPEFFQTHFRDRVNTLRG